MNKSELVEHIARRTKIDQSVVAEVVNGLIEAVTRSVARGDKVVLSRFGTFHRQARARRVARNVSTNQPVTVPARNLPAFRPGKSFKEAVDVRRASRRGGGARTQGSRSTPGSGKALERHARTTVRSKTARGTKASPA
jgi:DNA-binding protein HU-beta